MKSSNTRITCTWSLWSHPTCWRYINKIIIIIIIIDIERKGIKNAKKLIPMKEQNNTVLVLLFKNLEFGTICQLNYELLALLWTYSAIDRKLCCLICNRKCQHIYYIFPANFHYIHCCQGLETAMQDIYIFPFPPTLPLSPPSQPSPSPLLCFP